MSDEKALLAAIFGHPDEDAPRLVYADWLDEQGGESNADHAEYIRLSITLARDDPDYDVKLKRQRALFAKHYRDWYPELYGRKNILRGARGSPDMGRGFPYRLLCDASKLLDVGERLMQLAPITEVEFRNFADGELRRLIDSPWVRGLREVDFAAYSNAPDWAPLADCEHFAELRKLVLGGGYLRSDGAARIAAATPFPKLERLVLALESSCSGETLAALFGGVAFRTLRELRLSGGRSGEPMPGVRAVCAAPGLANLKSFDLGWQPTPGLTQMLTAAPFWPGLEELYLLRNNLRDDDLAAFLNTPSRLCKLDLDDNKITAKGAQMLGAHPMMERLTYLDLGRNKIGDAGLRALVGSPRARNLHKLELDGCGITPAGFVALAESPHLTNLRDLWMSSNTVDLKAARALCASPHLSGLTRLYLGSVTGTAKKELKARFGTAVSC